MGEPRQLYLPSIPFSLIWSDQAFKGLRVPFGIGHCLLEITLTVLVINIKIITKQTWIGFCSKLITCRGCRILEVYILGSAHYHLGMCIVLCFVYLDSIKKFGKLKLRFKLTLLIRFDVVISGFLWLKLRIPEFDKKKNLTFRLILH